ncbi:MAG: outer membrane beta-barrel family protein, partial [Bacteroidaceae bacterium]|nr:outer membrane beta-barrel family protein [Bacteroidaceae bacterium]
RADLWLTIHLPAGIDWETECEFTKRHGYSGNELNKLSCDWSMGLSKSILKDKIDLKLQAIDILHQYKSVAYVVNERGIRETRSVSLPAYLLCSMTYKFNKQPKRRE